LLTEAPAGLLDSEEGENEVIELGLDEACDLVTAGEIREARLR
jgi:hypothetical protein